jgi:hypothetical protein
MKTKAFYESKIFWFNALFLVASIAAVFGFGTYQPTALWLEITGSLCCSEHRLRLITATAIK